MKSFANGLVNDFSEHVHLYLPDYTLSYTIYLLAHHPDYKDFDDMAMLRKIRESLWFIIRSLQGKENEQYSYNFLYKICQDVKQTKDRDKPNDKNMTLVN